MIKVHFKLREPAKKAKTSIRLIVYLHGERLMTGTGLTIFPSLWDSKNMRPITARGKITEAVQKRLIHTQELSEVTIKLNNLENILVEEFYGLRRAGQKHITINDLRTALMNRIGDKKVKTVSIKEYIDDYIKKAESGMVLTESNQMYKQGSVSGLKNLLMNWKEFELNRGTQIKFEDFKKEYYHLFVKFLNDKNYHVNTCGKTIRFLKLIMKRAFEEGLHGNTAFKMTYFKAAQVDTDKAFLNHNEIAKIEGFISKDQRLNDLRNLWLFQYYIAQRFSDVIRVNFTHIKKMMDEKGEERRVLEITQQKTGKKVIVPLKSKAWNLLKLYDFKLPQYTVNDVNKGIKIVCTKLKMDRLVEVTQVRGGKESKVLVKRSSMISTHTARRSAATNMYLDGLSIQDIMKITGHESEQMLKKYLQIEEMKVAKKLMNESSYFD